MRIAIVGTGKMGKMHARVFSGAGHEVTCFDKHKTAGELAAELAPLQRVSSNSSMVASDTLAHAVKDKDVVVLLPPVDAVGEVASGIGSHLSNGTAVISGTSVMLPAAAELSAHLSGRDVGVFGMHCLFGPSATDFGSNSIAALNMGGLEPAAFENVKSLFRSSFVSRTGSAKIVDIESPDKHDSIMADTQVSTHLGFLSMGTAWMRAGLFPWESEFYKCGTDHAKAVMMLRVLNGERHVYEAIALRNPHARKHVLQYVKSVEDLFAMMMSGDRAGFTERMQRTREFLSRSNAAGVARESAAAFGSIAGAEMAAKSNSHLSLLAMADSWREMGTDLKDNAMCSTPPFQIRRFIISLAFGNELLERNINAAFESDEIKKHDAIFLESARDWSSAIARKDSEAYRSLFDKTRAFFSDRLEWGMEESTALIRAFRAGKLRG